VAERQHPEKDVPQKVNKEIISGLPTFTVVLPDNANSSHPKLTASQSAEKCSFCEHQLKSGHQLSTGSRSQSSIEAARVVANNL
jgi:hypothetical protein